LFVVHVRIVFDRTYTENRDLKIDLVDVKIHKPTRLDHVH